MNNEIVVKTQDLGKIFSEKEVIKNSNMTVRQGTIYGFLGANGAGKTTIFKMLAGLLVPTMGRAVVLGMDISKALKMVGLEYTDERPVSKYSLGMRQRLGIARALVHCPKLLLLDEPINGLDPMGIIEMRKLFLKLAKEQNVTIMISSHILSEIEHIADTIGVIVNGTVIQEVALTSIKDQYPSGLEEYFLNIMSGGKKND